MWYGKVKGRRSAFLKASGPGGMTSHNLNDRARVANLHVTERLQLICVSKIHSLEMPGREDDIPDREDESPFQADDQSRNNNKSTRSIRAHKSMLEPKLSFRWTFSMISPLLCYGFPSHVNVQLTNMPTFEVLELKFAGSAFHEVSYSLCNKQLSLNFLEAFHYEDLKRDSPWPHNDHPRTGNERS